MLIDETIATPASSNKYINIIKMNNLTVNKLTAFSVLIVGILILLTWTILITSGKITDFNSTPISYIFHWISEFITALLLLTTGFYIIRKHPLQQNILSLSLGCLVMSIGGAFAYYLLNFEIAMFTITVCIFGLTVILIILNYQKLQDFIFLTLGITEYSLLNLMGDAFQNNDIPSLILEIPAFLFLLILIIGILRKNISFRYLNRLK